VDVGQRPRELNARANRDHSRASDRERGDIHGWRDCAPGGPLAGTRCPKSEELRRLLGDLSSVTMATVAVASQGLRRHQRGYPQQDQQARLDNLKYTSSCFFLICGVDFSACCAQRPLPRTWRGSFQRYWGKGVDRPHHPAQVSKGPCRRSDAQVCRGLPRKWRDRDCAIPVMLTRDPEWITKSSMS
jgi:hypothetical protein